jgi:hypothetical protein
VRRFILVLELHDLLVKLALLGFSLHVLGPQLAVVLDRDQNFQEINL